MLNLRSEARRGYALSAPAIVYLGSMVTVSSAILIACSFWTQSYVTLDKNLTLLGLGVIDKPLSFLLYQQFAVVLTLTHPWAPFAILPIFVTLEKIDPGFLDAATKLGNSRFQRSRRVTLPAVMPAIRLPTARLSRSQIKQALRLTGSLVRRASLKADFLSTLLNLKSRLRCWQNSSVSKPIAEFSGRILDPGFPYRLIGRCANVRCKPLFLTV